MTQQPDHFHPQTVDEQIERLTHDMEGQQETVSQELVQHLHHFYHKQVEEKSVGSLDHAWERITHTQAYLTYEDTHTEQQGKKVRRTGTMKTLPDSTTDRPYDKQDMTVLPTRRRRVSRFMQNLAAVLLIGLLVGAFLILFRSQHTTTGGGLQAHSIIVASTTNGIIYGVQPDNGTIIWQHATGHEIGITMPGVSSIIVQGKVVYGIENNQAYALNALNGTTLWKKTLDAPPDEQYSTLQVDSGVVYVSKQVGGGGAWGHMYALQAKNGSVLWQHLTEEESLLTAANGIAYTYTNTVSGNTIVKAFESQNGQFLWQYTTNAMAGKVAQHTLYIISGHQQKPRDNGGNKQYKSLLALNARTGKLLWSKPVIGGNDNPLMIAKNLIIVGSFPDLHSYRNCAYHINDGSQAWCSEITTDSTNGNTTKYIVEGDTLYTIAFAIIPSSPSLSTCQMEANNISDGSIRWSHACAQIQGASFSLVGLNGTVFITEGGNTAISVLDSQGTIKKTFQLSDTGFITSLAAGWT